MTFVAVSAGQLIKASITNANLRHVGRMNSDMIPMDLSGVGVADGSLDLGASAYPWGDLYLKSGSKIYKGVDEFVGGGGGGGGIEVLETKSHLEQSGINKPISAIHGINESFTDTSNVVITPRVSYTAGTTFIADVNKTDIDLMEATTGWTGGKTTGTSATLATDTTAGERVQGAASNKLTIVAVSDLAWMIKDQTVFSLADQVVTLSMYLDNLPAAFTKASIRLSSTSGGATNYKQYDILKANLVAGAGTFNHISIDPTNDTADSSNGTYVIGLTIHIGIFFTFTSSSTMLAAVDFIVRQPNWVLPLPMSYYIWDDTNQERIAIASVAGTANYQRRTYTIAELAQDYAVDAAYAKERNVTISGNQGVFPAGASGAVAIATYDQTTTWFPDTVTGKTINMSQRFWDAEYKITALPSSTTTKIYSDTDLKAHYLSGDKVILYNKTWNGRKYNSFYNATVGSNFKLVTLTSNASYSGTDILLTHATAGDENTGMSVGNWYAVRYSAEMLYLLESANAGGALVTLPPTIFIPSDMLNKNPKFTTDFSTSVGWTLVSDSGTTWSIAGNVMTVTSGTNGYRGRAQRNLEGYGDANLGIEVKFTVAGYTSGPWGSLGVILGSSGASGVSSTGLCSGGTGVFIKLSSADATDIIEKGTTKATLASSAGLATNFYNKIWFTKKYIYYKCWSIASVEPLAWNLIGEVSGTAYSNGNYLEFCELANNGTTITIDDLAIRTIDKGYYVRGTVGTQSGSKLTTATKLTRSAAAQSPEIYQREAEVV